MKNESGGAERVLVLSFDDWILWPPPWGNTKSHQASTAVGSVSCVILATRIQTTALVANIVLHGRQQGKGGKAPTCCWFQTWGGTPGSLLSLPAPTSLPLGSTAALWVSLLRVVQIFIPTESKFLAVLASLSHRGFLLAGFWTGRPCRALVSPLAQVESSLSRPVQRTPFDAGSVKKPTSHRPDLPV